MTKGIKPNVISIKRLLCPQCGSRLSKKSKRRGQFVVYETKYSWKFKCMNIKCQHKMTVLKNPIDVTDKFKNDINETNIDKFINIHT